MMDRGARPGVETQAAFMQDLLRRVAALERVGAPGPPAPPPAPEHPYAAFTVTPGQDVNPVSATVLAITLAEEFDNDGSPDPFTLASNAVTVNFTGLVRISFGLILETASSAPSPSVRIEEGATVLLSSPVPGLTALNARLDTSYAWTDGSATASRPLAVTSGDVFRLFGQRTNTAGTVNTVAGSVVCFDRLA